MLRIKNWPNLHLYWNLMACFITLSINSLSFYTCPNYELSAQDNKPCTVGSQHSPNANNLNYLTFKLNRLLATAINTSTGHVKRLDGKMEILTGLPESLQLEELPQLWNTQDRWGKPQQRTTLRIRGSPLVFLSAFLRLHCWSPLQTILSLRCNSVCHQKSRVDIELLPLSVHPVVNWNLTLSRPYSHGSSSAASPRQEKPIYLLPLRVAAPLSSVSWTKLPQCPC